MAKGRSSKQRRRSSQVSTASSGSSRSSVRSSARGSARGSDAGGGAAPAGGGGGISLAQDVADFAELLTELGLKQSLKGFQSVHMAELSKVAALSEEHLEELCLDAGLGEAEYNKFKDRLRGFAAKKQAAAAAAAAAARAPEPVRPPTPPPLDEKQVGKLKQLFVKWDPDANGVLTPDQLRQGLKKVAKRMPAAQLDQIVADADQDGDGTIDYDEFVEVMDVMLSKGREPEPEPEPVDMDAPLTFGELRNPAKNWGKIKNAAKVAAKAGAAAAGQKAKKAVHKAIGIETIEEEEDEDWPEWKRTMLVDPGDSVEQVIAALPELVKPREPFDIFRAKTIKKLHERNPTMEYAFLKETAEQMWEVLFENEKEVYVQISEKEKEEHQQQLEHREVLDYALNTLGIVDPRYLWIAQLGWRAPLPSEDWIVCKDNLDDQERVYYYDQVNDVSQWEHPLDGHFRDQVRTEKEKLFKAAASIQSRWRGIKHRRNKEIMLHQAMLFTTATKLQAAFRGRRQRRRARSAKNIQRIFRGYRVRWRIDLIKENWAATLVSSAWKRKKAKRRLHALMVERREQEAIEAAQRAKDEEDYVLLWRTTVKMQRKWRGILEWRAKELRAITRLQAAFRGKRMRRIIEYAMVEERRKLADVPGGAQGRVKIKLAGKLQSMSVVAGRANRQGFADISTVSGLSFLVLLSGGFALMET